MSGNNYCRNCGRPTGDRHLVCWKCKRGLSRRVLVEEFKTEPNSYECTCRQPKPEFIRFFGGYQCGTCGYAIREGMNE